LSFILKALKKIENDAAKKDLSRLNPQKTDLFKAIEHQIHRNRYANKRNVILFTLLFIVVGSGIFIKLKPKKISTTGNTETSPATVFKADKNLLPALNTPPKKSLTQHKRFYLNLFLFQQHMRLYPKKPRTRLK
jgi:cell division septal protein FtsQ